MQGEMRAINMSTSEDMMREQLDRIIARAELRVEQQCTHASLAPYGGEAKRMRNKLALLLTSLAKLKTLSAQISAPQPRPSFRPAVGGVSGWKTYDGSMDDDHKKPGAERDTDPKTKPCLVQVAIFGRMGR